jgi:predicted dehydrogenase
MNRMNKLRIGIIGAGRIFWYSHQKNLARINGVEIAAVCDPNK